MTTSHPPKTPTSSEKPLTHQKTVSPQEKKPNARFLPLLIGLTAIAVGGTMGTLYFNFKSRQHFDRQTTEFLTQLNELKQQQISTSQETAAVAQSTQQKQQALNEKVSALSQHVHKALQQHWYQNNDWLLLKARYYLELAQINAHWSDQALTTIALLQEADNLLNTMHDEHLFTIRQAIAKEINELKSQPQINTIQILSQLDALQESSLHIPLKRAPAPITTGSNPQIFENESNTWHAHLSSSLKILEKLVVIQHHEKEIEPQFTQGYESLLRENIRMSLQEAQWAVLHSNKALYDFLIQQALTNIQRSFDIRAPITKALLQQLDDLKHIEFVKANILPKESLLELNQLIDSKEMREKPSPEQTPSNVGEPKS